MENIENKKPKSFFDWMVKSGYKSHGAWFMFMCIIIFGYISRFGDAIHSGYREDITGVMIGGIVLLGSFVGLIIHAIITYRLHKKNG